MAQPFHQTRLLLRQQLLTALGVASFAATHACAAESHPVQDDGGRVSSSGTNGSSSTTGTAADSGPVGPRDARVKGDASGGDASTQEDASAQDAAWTDATVMPEPPVCSELSPYNTNPPTLNCFNREQMENLVRYGTGMIPLDPMPSEEEVKAAFLDNGCLPQENVADGCCNPAVTEGVPENGSCCYYICSSGCCGRPFVVDGHARLAPVAQRTDWGGGTDNPWRDGSTTHAESRRIAAQWLEDARMEHASIAAFARFTQQLLALGAPADLVAGAARATADEVRHAELCFELAARYGLARRGPGALPEAVSSVSTDPLEACLSTFVEGCIGETVAAHQAAMQAEQASDEVVRVALQQIAADEARHSELAWRFVQWVVRRHDEVLPALQARLELALAEGPRSEGECEAPDTLAALHAAGRLSTHEQQSAHMAVLREVVAPCLAALVRDGAARAVA